MTRKLRLVLGLGLVLAAIALPVTYFAVQVNQDNQIAQQQNDAAKHVDLLEDPTLAAEAAAKEPSNQAAKPIAIATISIPRFGAGWVRVVYEGTSVSRVLTPFGVGHYSATSLPGEPGNFALAAHRAGSGGPFRNIDKFVTGDEVIVETSTSRFVYRYLESKVVEPSEVGVIAKWPVGLTAAAHPLNDSFLTLTSCTPIHVNTHRYVAWFELISIQDLLLD